MEEKSSRPHPLRLEAFKHPQFWVAVIAFVLVLSYPFITNTTWFKKNFKKVTGEELIVETAKEAVITTDKGEIVFSFKKNDAPKTSENFIRLASRKYYDGLTFHRVEEGFVIQGGDPNGDGTGGNSAFYDPKDPKTATFVEKADANSSLYKDGYKEGIVAMAKASADPAFTGGSQFFIMLADTQLPPDYTIFGKVTSGMDVVKKISKGDKMTKVEVR